MSDNVFRHLSQFIDQDYGIKLPPSKKSMLEARLQKRLRSLKMKSFEDYYDYVFNSHKSNEIINMVDIVTTNKTDFFREPAQFDFLVNNVLPELITSRGAGLKRKFTVWSAGCSTGEEPYTLAMILSNFAEEKTDFIFKIIATDISTQVLEKAKLGIYEQTKIAPIKMEFRKKYLLKSKNKKKRLVRIVPELRALVHFKRLNFMEDNFEIHEPLDCIFCRNVIIYFNRNTQEKLITKFYRYLSSDGYLFMGHSETLTGLNIPLISVAPKIYKKHRIIR